MTRITHVPFGEYQIQLSVPAVMAITFILAFGTSRFASDICLSVRNLDNQAHRILWQKTGLFDQRAGRRRNKGFPKPEAAFAWPDEYQDLSVRQYI